MIDSHHSPRCMCENMIRSTMPNDHTFNIFGIKVFKSEKMLVLNFAALKFDLL